MAIPSAKQIRANTTCRRVAWAGCLDHPSPLCDALDGKVFLAKTAPFDPPLFDGCECTWMEVGDDEVGDVDWFDPDEPGMRALLAERGIRV